MNTNSFSALLKEKYVYCRNLKKDTELYDLGHCVLYTGTVGNGKLIEGKRVKLSANCLAQKSLSPYKLILFRQQKRGMKNRFIED